MIKLSSKKWMKINTTNAKILKFFRVFKLKSEDRAFVNKKFDVFHDQKKLKWIIKFTSYAFPVFVIWHTMHLSDKEPIREKNDCKHTKIKQNYEIWFIFNVSANKHYFLRSRLQIHFNHESRIVFPSMESCIGKQTQINCDHTQKQWAMKRNDYELKKLINLCSTKNEWHIEKTFIRTNLHKRCDNVQQFFKKTFNSFF